MPSAHGYLELSRRERQIMDVVYTRGEASVNDVLADMPDPPSYSAVRALMRILEDKKHLRHRVEKGKFIYEAARPRDRAAKTALRRVMNTFFEGSAEQALAALLNSADTKLSNQELDRLAEIIDEARNEGR
jgi:BlaI family transcriptional regulator, penicillinase repressor